MNKLFSRHADSGTGYELSSKGDKRFSALNARLADGRTIEEHYQCDVKQYEPGGRNWRLGKGKPPLDPSVDTWTAYLGLWRQWAVLNPALIEELRVRSHGLVLTDMFASSPISQARALAEILNEQQNNAATNCITKAPLAVAHSQQDIFDEFIEPPPPSRRHHGHVNSRRP